ncbi:hypothetical protein FVA74_05650 [Salinibacterium sp. dk2585]|uniref:Mur ligase family protein n=1 Tax=unclassified Salinibacterium TaxID=2632331 RepID=UPI0011C24FCC|nr:MULTISPECIES: Mur ligase family protein [unclassified Salinibacterium]QEE61115.1 hypothetical protein FVA74_05650 [Salinibacterium sp. dk2585]TXK53058.1 hypothetical protein FVP63_11770 [Salinibacterium sp. dk5596]
MGIVQATASVATVVGTVGRSSTSAMLTAVLGATSHNPRRTVVLLSRGSSEAAPDAPAKSWGEVLSSLDLESIVAVPASDARLIEAARLTGARVVTFGFDATAEVRGAGLHASTGGTDYAVTIGSDRADVRLSLLGEHLAENSLGALAAAHANGVPLANAVAALEALSAAGEGIMSPVDAGGDILLIDDSASMAPESVTAGLKALAMFGTEGHRTVAVIGELDLGPSEDSAALAAELHREAHDRIGRIVVRLNISSLIVVGDNARHIHNAAGLEGSWNGESVLVADAAAAYDRVREVVRPGDVVLVKSREAATTILSALGAQQGGAR